MLPGKLLGYAGLLIIMAAPASQVATSLSLVDQVAALPDDFHQHFFDLPISARVTLDGKILGDAMIMLTSGNTVQLLKFAEGGESTLPESERQKWLGVLSSPVPLGRCDSGCAKGLVAIDYNLSDATLALMTATTTGKATRWRALPEKGSFGGLMSNDLNLVTSNGDSSGRLLSSVNASMGNWSLLGAAEIEKSSTASYSNSAMLHRISDLTATREYPGHFLRAGLFTPDTQGILNAPRTPGGRKLTTAGVMIGTSDTLLPEGPQASVYPVWVTANRDSIVEVWRDGALVNSQPVTSGLQALDTTRLPGGIWQADIRLIEAGREVSRSSSLIYKPNGWSNTAQKVRYSAFAGQETRFWDNTREKEQEYATAGLSLNYLASPGVITGAAIQHSAGTLQTGISADWWLSDQTRLYGNAFSSQGYGNGFDAQASWRGASTSIMLNHSRTWQNEENDSDKFSRRAQLVHNSGVSGSWRLSSANSFSARVSHNSNVGGAGYDLSWTTRHDIKGTPVSFKINTFDRPYGSNSATSRNSGFGLNMSFALNGGKRSVNASLGNRTDSRGQRSTFASLGSNQQIESGLLRSVSTNITADNRSVGGSLWADYYHPAVSGDIYGQYDSLGVTTAGLNLKNVVAAGGGKVTSSGKAGAANGTTAIIVDVESEESDLQLEATDEQGSRTKLKKGRNLVPVNAHRAGQLHIGFNHSDAPALKVMPDTLDYHLNKGGVTHKKVSVMKTVTVLGRLMDRHGQPLQGARVINHAGRSISEADGFFTLEMSSRIPVIRVEHTESSINCEINFDPARHRYEGDVVMAGNLQCPAS